MSIVLNNGSTVVAKRRERPKLLFDESGKPTHLYNGVLLRDSAHQLGATMYVGRCLFKSILYLCIFRILYSFKKAERELSFARCSPVRVITVVTLSHRMKLRRDLRGKKNNYFVP